MQVIQITSLTGHSPYDITICDITKNYCYSGATGVTSVPLIIDLPIELSGSSEVIVVVTDSIGCEEIQLHACGGLIPTPTPTPTPTITPTNPLCNCLSIENPSGVTLNFAYTQCDGTLFYGEIYSATTLFVCGSSPYGDTGLIFNVSSDICINNECPQPTPTPTTTPTPTPTLPPIVGYFQDSCNPSYEFTLSDIPVSFSPLSGDYYVESSGYVGCAISITGTSSTNIFSFVALGSQPSTYHCQKANFIYPCPTLTPTPSITPTITPTTTLTPTPTLTQTPTNTPTPSQKYTLYQVISCCDKTIKYMMLPVNFLPGTAILNTLGECHQIVSRSLIRTFVTDYWDHGTTYMDCTWCIKYNTCTPTPPPSFISVWTTTSPNESIILPYETTGSYSGTIDWGDGTTSINTYANRAHTYTTPGNYTITISGTLIGWSFLVNPISKNNISEILQWGCLRLGNSLGYFYLCINLSLSNVSDVLNLTGTNDLSYMFTSCQSLTNIPNINSWDTSNVVNMAGMFNDCSNFDDNIGSWDVSNVTDMQQMFESNYAFNNGGSPSISNWNTISVTNMFEMFFDSVFNQPISGWNVSNVINMSSMFNASQFNQNINNWDVGNVTDMSYMFSSSPFNQPLSGWNVSNVTNMSWMFGSTTFNQPINSWDVSSVTNMSSMFVLNSSFNQNLNSWNTSSVTDMSTMFLLSYNFNGNISSWNVSSVTDMNNMFAGASLFNQNISGWNVSGVTNMSSMFNGASSFNQLIAPWNVSNVTNMSSMFRLATAFNQNIAGWDISNVTNFTNFMFGKTEFNYLAAYLDQIYVGWSSLPSVQTGININFGTIKYTAAGSAGKAILQGTYGWTITDGGI